MARIIVVTERTAEGVLLVGVYLPTREEPVLRIPCMTVYEQAMQLLRFGELLHQLGWAVEFNMSRAVDEVVFASQGFGQRSVFSAN